jgi:hypothetical protein
MHGVEVLSNAYRVATLAQLASIEIDEGPLARSVRRPLSVSAIRAEGLGVMGA